MQISSRAFSVGRRWKNWRLPRALGLCCWFLLSWATLHNSSRRLQTKKNQLNMWESKQKPIAWTWWQSIKLCLLSPSPCSHPPGASACLRAASQGWKLEVSLPAGSYRIWAVDKKWWGVSKTPDFQNKVCTFLKACRGQGIIIANKLSTHYNSPDSLKFSHLPLTPLITGTGSVLKLIQTIKVTSSWLVVKHLGLA